MGIDDSILTFAIFTLCAIIFCVKTYKKTRNGLRTVFMFLWITAIYFVISCCIFPIQFTNSGVHMPSFESQFSMMTFDQFRMYFFDYFLFRISYFASFLTFAFVACILFKSQRKFRNCCVLLLGLMLIHLTYNICLNVIIDEVVKSINAEDFLIMSIGFTIGWICAKIALLSCPAFGKYVLKSGE